MLPFLKNKQQSVAGLIIKNRAPDKSNDSEDLKRTPEDCARDLISAIEAKDAAGIVKAIKDIADGTYANEEKSDTPSPHTYDAQNQLAAKKE